MKRVTYVNRKEKWWFHAARGMNLFAYRFWWLVLLVFVVLITLFYFFCWQQKDKLCEDSKYALAATNDAINNSSNCCECEPEAEIIDSIPKAPQKNCRVHFSGLMIGGRFWEGNISKIYEVDRCSEYVGAGHYSDNTKAFPKSVANTFDGIAIDAGTRVMIYSEKNFKGRIVLDKTGPAIINNILWKDDERYNVCNTDDYPIELQTVYPQSTREWSSENMHPWSYGSLKIICE